MGKRVCLREVSLACVSEHRSKVGPCGRKSGRWRAQREEGSQAGQASGCKAQYCRGRNQFAEALLCFTEDLGLCYQTLEPTDVTIWSQGVTFGCVFRKDE